jgi:hypothetical protein
MKGKIRKILQFGKSERGWKKIEKFESFLPNLEDLATLSPYRDLSFHVCSRIIDRKKLVYGFVSL